MCWHLTAISAHRVGRSYTFMSTWKRCARGGVFEFQAPQWQFPDRQHFSGMKMKMRWKCCCTATAATASAPAAAVAAVVAAAGNYCI